MSDMAAIVATALEHARNHITKRAVTEEQRALLLFALDSWAGSAEQPASVAILPRLVYAAAGGQDNAAAPLSALTVLLIAGLELLDAIMDEELEPRWQPYGAGRALLTGLTLACALPHLLLTELQVGAARARLMQRAFAHSAVVASAGQDGDLRLQRGPCTVAEVEAVALRKSGEPLALLATLAALLAGAPAAVVQHYAAMAREMGAVAQYSADCHDVWFAAHSRDFAAGARTLPIALRLHLCSEDERDGFLALLDRARHDETVRDEVRRALCTPDVLALCEQILGLHRYRALRELAATGARDPPAARLRHFLDGVSATASAPRFA